MRNTKLVEILGEQVILSECDWGDIAVLQKTRFADNADLKAMFEMVTIIFYALKPTIRELKWYQFRKQYIYRWKLRFKSLKKLGVSSELPKLAIECYKLNGIDTDKLLEEERQRLLQGEKKKTSKNSTPN